MSGRDLERLCGQLVVGGFVGTELPTEIETALTEERLAGVILFKRNLPDLETTHRLCSAIAKATPAPFIGVDEEGGRVRRLPSPALKLPPMRQLAAEGATRVEQAGRAIGEQLSALGFNIDFAPVLDVDSNPQNPVIGDRAFSDDPDAVVELARALARGLGSAGVLACGKHFPGHGDTAKDSHFDLPRVDHDRERLNAIELFPFRKLAGELPAIMSAHVVYAALDASRPSTLSPRVATELLRGELGFRGVLFSDDLEMGALSKRRPIEDSAVLAVAAGCDVLLVCKDVSLQARAVRALVREATTSPAFRARCEEARSRSAGARAAHPPSPASSAREAVRRVEGAVAAYPT